MLFNKYDEIKWGYSENINTIRAFYGEALDDNGNITGYVSSNFRGTNRTPCYDRTDDYFNRVDIYTVSTVYIGNYQMYDKDKYAHCYNYYKNPRYFYGFKEKIQKVLSTYYIKDINDEEIMQLMLLIRATKGYLKHVDDYLSCLNMGVCNSCDKYDMLFNLKNVNGDYYCKSCASTLEVCPNCGRLIAGDNKKYNGLCLDCADRKGKLYVHDYHDFGYSNYKPRGAGNYHFGIELEFNSSLTYKWIGADVIKNADTEDLFHFERDSSITGFEMISQPCSLDYWKAHENYLQGLLDIVQGSFKTITNNNGFHVHISTESFKDEKAVARFITINSYYKNFLIALARREPTDYCHFHNIPLKRYYSFIGNNIELFSGHRTFINVHASGLDDVMDTKTIEVRYFKSTFNASEVIKILSLLKKMIDLANNGTTVYYEDLFENKESCKAIPFKVIDNANEKSKYLRMKQAYFYNDNVLVLIGIDLYSIIGYDSKTGTYILGKKSKNKKQKSEFRKVLKEINNILVDKKEFYKNGNDWEFMRVSRKGLGSFFMITREAIKDVI